MSRGAWLLAAFAAAVWLGWQSGNKGRDLLAYWAGRVEGYRAAQPKRLSAPPPPSPYPLSGPPL